MKGAFVVHPQVEAQRVAARLRAAGIRAVVKMDMVAMPSIPLPSAWVEDDAFRRARDILGEPADAMENEHTA